MAQMDLMEFESRLCWHQIVVTLYHQLNQQLVRK